VDTQQSRSSSRSEKSGKLSNDGAVIGLRHFGNARLTGVHRDDQDDLRLSREIATRIWLSKTMSGTAQLHSEVEYALMLSRGAEGTRKPRFDVRKGLSGKLRSRASTDGGSCCELDLRFSVPGSKDGRF
jgi:hypothetical protein